MVVVWMWLWIMLDLISGLLHQRLSPRVEDTVFVE